jgi:hypothetical protein
MPRRQAGFYPVNFLSKGSAVPAKQLLIENLAEKSTTELI